MTIPTLHVLIDALASGILLGGLFAVTALGLSLVFGVMRMINLVHGEILVLGAYLSLELTRVFGLDPLLSIALVAPVLFLVALPLFRFVLEPVLAKGPEPTLLTTFGLSIIAQSVFILVFSGDTQTLKAPYSSRSVSVAGFQFPVMYLVSFGVGLLLCGTIDQLMRRTGFGREVRAAAEDREAAATLGVDVRRTNRYVFAIAAACAGIGGILVGSTFAFTPTSGLNYLLSGFAVVVLGGLGSVRGTLVGALALGVIESVGAAFVGDGYRDFIGLVTFLVVLSVRPQGLFGRKQVA
jgi:branched-chain amino acid transport system permease protein